MAYAHVNGIKMYYEVHGEGTPLVLIQGFTRNTLTWNAMLELLKSHYQLILLDNRGSGRTQHPVPPYNVEQMAKDTVELLNTLNIQEAHFLGHSMGGAIVQQICIDYPEKVKKAILCSTTSKFPFTSLMQIDTVAEMALAGVPMEFIFLVVLPRLFSSACLEKKDNPDKIIEIMLKDPFPQAPEGYLGQGEALKTFNATDKLSMIKAPCLILVGEDDLYTPVSCSNVLKEKIKMAQLKVVPQQGHMINEEIPELLCQEVKAFLAS